MKLSVTFAGSVEDQDFRTVTGRQLRREAEIYSTLDGKVGERIVAALDDLAGGGRPHALEHAR